MAVRLNEDKEMVKTIRDGLKRTGGYCPCRLERSEENKCICKEFRDQIADPEYHGFCHCMLYYKEKGRTLLPRYQFFVNNMKKVLTNTKPCVIIWKR